MGKVFVLPTVLDAVYVCARIYVDKYLLIPIEMFIYFCFIIILTRIIYILFAKLSFYSQHY